MRISREQHVPDSIACTPNQTSRVEVGCGAARAVCVQPTAPLHTLSKEKKRIRLNILLLGVVGTSTRAVATLQKTPVKICLTTWRSKIIDALHLLRDLSPLTTCNNLLRDLRYWYIHNLSHGSLRHPLLQNHLDHANDLPSMDLRHRNSDNYQVHQAHMFIVTLTQGYCENVSCAPPTPRTVFRERERPAPFRPEAVLARLVTSA